MIGMIGDIHAAHMMLQNIVKKIEAHNKMCDDYARPEKKITVIIQVGDYGWYKFSAPWFQKVVSSIPIYWIEGNHEDFNMLKDYTEVTEVAPNQFFVPRGIVLELDGRRVAFMGGAGSVDKAYNPMWSELENITDEQLNRLNTKEKVDLLITHVPPQSVIEKHFDPKDLAAFGLPDTWSDINAWKIQRLWNNYGKPPLVCGHMHKSVVDGNVRILNEGELYAV
jgi:UDP-2,3-diacylglucosamine pyrophosphatase LpxH